MKHKAHLSSTSLMGGCSNEGLFQDGKSSDYLELETILRRACFISGKYFNGHYWKANNKNTIETTNCLTKVFMPFHA